MESKMAVGCQTFDMNDVYDAQQRLSLVFNRRGNKYVELAPTHDLYSE